MFFSGGMIPSYFLVRDMGLLDTYFSLIVPGSISAYNIILVRNFFRSLPVSLFEAAQLDGASEWKVLTQITLPLSKPILAVITLFTSVSYWNSYFNAILYIRSNAKWPLQLVLREIIMDSQIARQSGADLLLEGAYVQPVMLQYAAIVVAMVPILCVYPFLQKFFEKGIMIGSVKG